MKLAILALLGLASLTGCNFESDALKKANAETEVLRIELVKVKAEAEAAKNLQSQAGIDEKELAALQGAGVPVRAEEGGHIFIDDKRPDDRRRRLIVRGNKVDYQENGVTILTSNVMLLNSTRTPRQFDTGQDGLDQKEMTIYVRSGEYMIQCGKRNTKTRPVEFASGTVKGGDYVTVWKIEK